MARRMEWIVALILVFASVSSPVQADESVKIGLATILSGDLSVLGDNAQKTVQIYQKFAPNPRLQFRFEDARLSSADGLRAYQKLVTVDKVDLAIAVCTSNATMASVGLLAGHKTPVISVSTGGSNIDNAGDFVFRIGNSDSLNGIEQAQHFVRHGINKVAVLTEETEYTHDITKFFLPEFKKSGGQLVFNEEFLPGTTDFRALAAKIKEVSPQAIFMPTQTGSALGIFLKQWNQVSPGSKTEIHTTFVAGPNRDAHEIAGPLIVGVYFMEPVYSVTNERRQKFFELFKKTFGNEPSIPFHTAGLVDTLDLVSLYLKEHPVFDQESFRRFLLDVKNYDGMLGKLSFDDKGNTSIGFRIHKIEANLAGAVS